MHPELAHLKPLRLVPLVDVVHIVPLGVVMTQLTGLALVAGDDDVVGEVRLSLN